jgi:hypothetical protein
VRRLPPRPRDRRPLRPPGPFPSRRVRFRRVSGDAFRCRGYRRLRRRFDRGLPQGSDRLEREAPRDHRGAGAPARRRLGDSCPISGARFALGAASRRKRLGRWHFRSASQFDGPGGAPPTASPLRSGSTGSLTLFDQPVRRFASGSELPHTAEINRDRGERYRSSPPTPPHMRVRIRRFGWLSVTCAPVRVGNPSELR